jgi:hypothetical protein
VYAVVGTALIWIFHADNIQRLRSGEERRIEWRFHGRPGPSQGPQTKPQAADQASEPRSGQ